MRREPLEPWGELCVVGAFEMSSDLFPFVGCVPIITFQWETYVPFYKMHTLEDNTWLQFMKGNWTYADGRKMFDKPAGAEEESFFPPSQLFSALLQALC